jgi:hypothetical protein
MVRLRIASKLITPVACACRLAGLAGPGSRAATPAWRRRAHVCAVVAVVLAAVGRPGVSPAVAGTGPSPGLTWTKQAPAASPPAGESAVMAYDAATGTVVMFGGFDGNFLADTWTWGPR